MEIQDKEFVTKKETALPSKIKTTFRGDVLRLVSGTAAAQGITLAAAPLLTRIFSPEAFGLAALYLALASIAGVVSCLRYELGIVLPDDDDEAANVFGLAILCSAVISLLLAALVWFFGPILSVMMDAPKLAPLLWLLPVSTFVHGTYLALNYWNTRTKRFLRLSIARVGQTAGSVSGNLIAGSLGHASGGAMIIAHLVGQIVGVSLLGGQIFREYGRFFVTNIRWRGVRRQAERYAQFPKYSVGSAVMNACSAQIPVVLLGYFFNPTIVGFYALGLRVVQTPLSMIGGAVSQVFVQRAARARAEGAIAPLMEAALRRLWTFGLVPCLAMAVIGGDLFSWVFGTEWREAGVYAQMLSFWLLTYFISSPLSHLYIVLERQDFELKINFVILTCRCLAIVAGGLLQESRLAVGLYSLFGIFAYLYLLTGLSKIAGLGGSGKIWSLLVEGLVKTYPYVLILLALFIISPSLVIMITIAGAVCCIHYYNNRSLLFGRT